MRKFLTEYYCRMVVKYAEKLFTMANTDVIDITSTDGKHSITVQRNK